MALTTGAALVAALQISLAQGVQPASQTAEPPRQLAHTPLTLRIGPQRLDLVRYNRVEALSVGVRGQARPDTPIGPLSLTGTFRIGAADRHPNGRLDIVDETVDHRIVVSGYHELATLEERARHFGIANTLMALLAGRDDGDYYRRSGATVEWTPATASPRWFRVRATAEYQQGVHKETEAQAPWLWDDNASFRDNIEADDAWEYGGSVELTPRWGTDPARTSGGVGAFVQGAVGDAEYVRASLDGDVALALPSHFRVVLEAGAGTSWGEPSVQRLWYLGGPLTLRGYRPLSAGGKSFGRGRVELDRSFFFGRVSVFSDVGWAGEKLADLELDDTLRVAGAGLAVIDGIVRIDGAWRLDAPHRFRLDVYLDQIL